ncbi:MAG: citrate lyase acyl carrier protein [Clostridia bacterium]|nr:citrate lyase acyl carrier protein [Clostridia bacterium]
MEIKRTAVAGTLESSDVQVTIEPGDEGLELELSSSVINQYGRRIREVAFEVLGELGVDSARVSIVDKGALDCTIRARIGCAVFRACEVTDNYPWGEVIKP